MAGTATPRKRTARKATATKPPVIGGGAEITDEDIAKLEAQVDESFQFDDSPIGPDGEIRPVEIGRAGKAGPEMVHIFSIGGEKFFVPKTPSPAIMLRFMREARDKRVGRDVAVERALISMLGKQGLDALAESEETTDDDVANVFIIVGHILFGAIKRWRAAADPS